MIGAIKAKTLNNVLVQENGIVRDGNGSLIARLVDSVSFEDIESVPAETLVSQPSEPLAERYYMNLPKDRSKILDVHHHELFTVDILEMVNKHIERTIDNFIHKEKEVFGYWTNDIKQLIQEKLAEKFVNTYYEEIFAGIARDETLTILIREKVIADMAKSLHR